MNRQENIQIMCVDKGLELTGRLRNLFLQKHIEVYRESRIDKLLERFEKKSYDILIITGTTFKQGSGDGIELLEVISAKMLNCCTISTLVAANHNKK